MKSRSKLFRFAPPSTKIICPVTSLCCRQITYGFRYTGWIGQSAQWHHIPQAFFELRIIFFGRNDKARRNAVNPVRARPKAEAIERTDAASACLEKRIADLVAMRVFDTLIEKYGL